MMRMSGAALSLGMALLVADAAAAADQYGGPPRGPGPTVVEAARPPLLLPPCRDSFWGSVLLHCIPRGAVYPAYDDVYAQNQIRGLRPPKRKPYIQVFSW